MSASPLARTDCHQHLWSPAVLEALRRSTRAPRLVGWELRLDGEPPYAVEPADHDLTARLTADAAELALHSLSSPLGIETLPSLRIGFVALAGLAPLHHERLAQRGRRLGPLDPGVFYDTSS